MHLLDLRQSHHTEIATVVVREMNRNHRSSEVKYSVNKGVRSQKGR